MLEFSFYIVYHTSKQNLMLFEIRNICVILLIFKIHQVRKETSKKYERKL